MRKSRTGNAQMLWTLIVATLFAGAAAVRLLNKSQSDTPSSIAAHAAPSHTLLR